MNLAPFIFSFAALETMDQLLLEVALPFKAKGLLSLLPPFYILPLSLLSQDCSSEILLISEI